jgi:serine protease Do
MLHQQVHIPVWCAAVAVCISAALGGLAVSLPTPADVRPTFSLAVPPNQAVGVSVQDITPQTAAAFGLRQNQGAVVTALDCGTLQAGDVILSVNGQNVSRRRALEMLLAEISPTDALLFQVSRNGETREVVVQRTAGEVAPSRNQTIPATVAPGFRGVRVDNLSSGMTQSFNLSAQGSGTPGNGIVVTEVERGTPAEAAGLHSSDIIAEVNNLPVWNVEQFLNYVQMLSGQNVVLTVARQGIRSIVVVPSW